MNKLLQKFKNMSDNNKTIYKNVLVSGVLKGLALIISLFSFPAYISFFNNNEVLGLWYTILSLLNWILNFDLGIGNGLRNHLSDSLSKNDEDTTKKLIASAYFSIGGFVVICIVVFPIVLRLVNLNSMLNISGDIVSSKSLYVSVIIVVVGVMLQFLLKLINSILYAMQKSAINDILFFCTNVATFLFALLCPSRDNNSNIVLMALVYSIAVASPLLVATIVIFASKLKYAVPRIKNVSKNYIKKVLSLGGAFFFVQIIYMLITSTNEILVNTTSGNTAVVEYQIYNKIFTLLGTVFALAVAPLWSIVTKAKAENNILWIRQTYKRFMLVALLFCLGEVLLIFLMEPLINIWLGENTLDNVNLLTGFLFAAFGCIMMLNSVQTVIANGLGELKTQIICYSIGAFLKIPLSYILVEILGSWEGVVLASIICMGICCVVQPFTLKKVLKISTIKEE